jgi:hypothetical protein
VAREDTRRRPSEATAPGSTRAVFCSRCRAVGRPLAGAPAQLSRLTLRCQRGPALPEGRRRRCPSDPYTRPVSQVFVSHASADKLYVEAFVDDILIRGCGLKPTTDIFYSSGADTGIASGADLMADVRKHVGSTTLVVAMITPMFQTRPVCIAELGAAWGRDGVLFPLLAPGMPRTDLEGVIPGLAARPSDDPGTLDELAERIKELGFEINVKSWGTGKEKWLGYLRNHAGQLEVPETITADEVVSLQTTLEAARQAFDEELKAHEALQEQFEQLKAAKTAEEVREALLPENDVERLEALADAANTALQRLPPIVRDAIWFDLAEQGMPWPDAYEDPTAYRNAQDQQREGLLIENNSDHLSANEDFPNVKSAATAVAGLQEFLQDPPSDHFPEWFRSTYEVPLDLCKRGTWRALLE